MACMITLSLASCGGNTNKSNMIAADEDSVTSEDSVASADSMASETVEASTIETNQSENEEYQKVDFIRGGVTYKGLEVRETAGFNMNEHSETEYTIQCFKDGTLIWTEKHTFQGKTTKSSYQGRWDKQTVSKFDEEFTGYNFWADTYSGGKSPLGWADNDGNLHTAMSNERVACKLRAQ